MQCCNSDVDNRGEGSDGVVFLLASLLLGSFFSSSVVAAVEGGNPKGAKDSRAVAAGALIGLPARVGAGPDDEGSDGMRCGVGLVAASRDMVRCDTRVLGAQRDRRVVRCVVGGRGCGRYATLSRSGGGKVGEAREGAERGRRGVR